MRNVKIKLCVILATVVILGAFTVQAIAAPRMYLKGIPANPAVDEIFTVTVMMEGVDNLRGLDFSLIYDSGVLEAQDSDASVPGKNMSKKISFGDVDKNQIFEGTEKTDKVLGAGYVEKTQELVIIVAPEKLLKINWYRGFG